MDKWDKEWDREFPKSESKENEKDPRLIENATNRIMEDYRFLTIEETEQILYYRDGVYVPGGEKVIEKEAEDMYGYQLTTGSLSQIIGHIKRRTYHKHEELDSNINIINLKNGLYDIKKDVLLDHNPNYLSINQKEITFDENVMPKRFGSFLKEVLHPLDIRTAIEAMAYTFHRDYIVETIFMLYGHGANGKTVYTSLLTALHGQNNVSNVPLSEMLGDRFALSDLENKDLNIDNELGGQTIKEAAVLKRLTSGSRQRIRIQRKGQKAYDTTLYSKLFFNANKIPDSLDLSNAFNRRIIIITFPNIFEGADEDKQLISKLTLEEEMSGIFNVVMIALRQILRDKELYVNEKTIQEKRKKYERATNPIKSFIDETVSEESIESAHIPKSDLYNVYLAYCTKHRLPAENYDHFCKILKKVFDFVDGKVTINNGDKLRVSCWKGILLMPEFSLKTAQTKLEEVV